MDEDVSMSARVSELARIVRSSKCTDEQAVRALHDAHERDIAASLELLDTHQRAKLYRLIGAERLGDVFAYVSDAGKYLRELPQEQAADIVESMDADDAVDALETVSPELRSALMEKLDPESQHDIRLICSYQPDEIGSAMSTNFVSISRHLSVKQAMRALVAQAEENDNISTLFVNDDDGSFYGAIALKDLIVAREETALDSLISRHFPAVLAHEQIEACLDRLRSYAEASIPVLGEKRRVIGVIEYAAETLSGIPSIIYGLVGMLFFCQFLNMKTSLLAGALTLVIMNLPTIMRTTQESLKTVPQSYREGAFGLGAGKWRVIRTVVLPGCVDGVITGCILSVGRILGESAALLFTAGFAHALNGFFDGLSSAGATLTVALYVYAKEQGQFDVAFAIAAILMLLTLLINGAAMLVERYFRRKRSL